MSDHSGGLRVLIIVPEPVVSVTRGGGLKRTWYLMRELEAGGMATTLWGSVSPEIANGPSDRTERIPVRTFMGRQRKTTRDKLGALLSPLPDRMWQLRSRKPRTDEMRDFDVLVYMAPSSAEFGEVARVAGVPVVLDLRDERSSVAQRIAPVIDRRIARWRSLIDARKWLSYQRRLAGLADVVTVVSEREAEILQRVVPGVRCSVSPNGVDTNAYEFADHSISSADTLLMTGHFGYWPNIDAAKWLTSEILPALRRRRPKASLQLVGFQADVLGQLPGATIHANAPDIAPYFDSADLMIVPLRAGGGTRLKLLEAFSKGLPVVTTPVGAEGLAVQHGVHALLGATRGALVEHAVTLLSDSGLRRRLAVNARRLVEDRYDWSRVGRDFANIVSDVANRADGRRRYDLVQ